MSSKWDFLKIIYTYMDASFLATIGLIVMEFMLQLSLVLTIDK